MPRNRVGGRRAAVALLALTASAAPALAQNDPVTVSVDVAANRRAIDPRIYGVHFAMMPTLLDLNATINRYGGNSSGRYNWLDNIDNRGGDFYFESIPYFPRTPGTYMDEFIQTTKAGGAEPFLTMPMVGSVAKANGNDTLWSFSVAACGPQTDTDPFTPNPDAGNGCSGAGMTFPCVAGAPMRPPYILGCDPVNAASIPANQVFQQGFVQHVKDTFGAASAGGLKYWGTDNEPTIWHNVYWDVHPQGATDAEVRDKMFDYGDMIKGVDAGVRILGPEEWGWDGYFYSGRDQQLIGEGLCGGANCPDHLAHGDYVPYLIAQMRQHEIATGKKVLDMLTLHFYPQGDQLGDYEFSDDVTFATQQLRNRSTRGLWDPNYVNESWIQDTVQLIPRMKTWASAYPGTPIGLTEYNWGAEFHINGATAQADLLGIFGREGLDMAVRWTVPPTGSHVYNAFKMYRNYDGAQSAFGDTSVSAVVPEPDNLAAFAAQRTASGALTIMVVNKVLAETTATTVNLANFVPGAAAQRWEMTDANVITRLADVPVAAGSFTVTLQPQTITLFVVPSATPPPGTLTIDDVSVTEGTGGPNFTTFTVTRGGDTSSTVTVDYATAPGTAVAGSDYTAGSGTLTFAPGVTTQPVVVSIVTDSVNEPNEQFHVDLSNPVNATLSRSRGTATIVDDDGGTIPLFELTAGQRDLHDFSAASQHLYTMRQQPYTSYEVTLEDVAGKPAAPAGAQLDRVGPDTTTVVQAGAATGPGSVRVLRWENDSATAEDGQYIRIGTTTCPCGAGDRYRVRATDTSGAIPRFNNSGSQITVALLQNETAQTVAGHLRFWNAAGALLHSEPFTIAPHGLLAQNTSMLSGLAGASGSVTIGHNGGHGALVGKAVALEPATGFSFDSPMQLR